MLVQDMLMQSAMRRPDAVALVAGERRMTYQALEEAATRCAWALRAQGVQRGQRVIVLLESGIDAVTAIFGILKVGAVFVVVHPGAKYDKLAGIVADAEPVALITDSKHGRALADGLAAPGSLQCIFWTDNQPLPLCAGLRSVCWSTLAVCPLSPLAAGNTASDLAMLIYTSGSSGPPKGVMAAHSNMLAAVTSVNQYLQHTPTDVILNLLPLSFTYGLYQLFLAAQAGACVVLDQGFAFPARTLALLATERVTGLPGVPTLFALLLRYPALLTQPLPALRYVTNAGAAIPPSHLLAIQAAWPQTRFYSMYGQTECMRISYLPPAEVARRPASVGIAIPNTAVSIVDEQGQPVLRGTTGELVVRGPHITQGYWRAAELTHARFRPGPQPGERLLYTGDLFRMDSDGYLYFVARQDDIIKTRGEKVSPFEVEQVACRFPGVAEAAVVGIPDSLLGQTVLLLVVAQEGVELMPALLRAHCARLLEAYMVPQVVRVVPALPRLDNGKLDKHRLQCELASCTTTS